ncbi:DUF6177 family protein [Streptomyces zagrosensis]|uniref:Uncharacterized protein n=1 Tax=Streptomyces zagrosensis TaxID=1042984 RepID=A0A7W9Q5B5_9ACTN|nr:DUF6177 family protein [Streptomyces zagrosensis]MBB5933919.1 hypothetical protein [Streptomyces zagrosensis]
MTKDVIALTERMPQAWSLMAGLVSGGPDMTMATAADGAVVQLCDADGRPLVSIETPLLIRVPGEAARLLDVRVEGPVWWTEIRAATAAQRSGRLAGVIASRLVSQLGGSVWPREAAVTDFGRPVTDVASATAPAAAQPAVDVLSDKVAVVIQDRPLVAMTSWLAEALEAAVSSDRGLQIVTQASARLTLPLRAALSGAPNRWVVGDGVGGYYDGLSGSELRWTDGAFVATGVPAPAFLAAGESQITGCQLALSFRTRKPAEADLLLGGALECAWRRLTGGPPHGWGSAEPAGQPWSRPELTDFVRERSPQPTWTVAVGSPDHPALATLRTGLTTGGVEEDATLTLGFPSPADEPDSDCFADLVAELAAEHGLVSLLVQRRAARADLTVPPVLEGAPVPLGFALGRDDVRAIGVTAARRPPSLARPVQLGSRDKAAFYYPLDASAAGPGWASLERLMSYLYGDALAGVRVAPAAADDEERSGPGNAGSAAPK